MDAKTPAVPAALPVPPPVLVLAGPVPREDVRGLCGDVGRLLAASRARVVVCDVGGLGPPGLGAVELLARLRLAALRAGGGIRLRDPDPALLGLLDLVGLPFEVERQPEQREPPARVQEAVEPGDPPL